MANRRSWNASRAASVRVVFEPRSGVHHVHEGTSSVVFTRNAKDRIEQRNREQSINMLRAKLLEHKRAEDAKRKEGLKSATKSADFGSQIRSYVLHPYQMVKDLRTGAETGNIQAVLDGELESFIRAYLLSEEHNIC